jgi:hypothetical protein
VIRSGTQPMIEALICRTYRKHLTNLALQENRLHKQLAHYKAQLQQIHDHRERLASPRRRAAMLASHKARTNKQPFDAAEFGFEFSEEYLAARHEAFSAEHKTILLDFDRAWKANMRQKAA